MDFREIIETRRSIRSFQDRDIPADVLERILDAARVAPSGNNTQPWYFVAVRDVLSKRRLAEYAYDQSFVANAPVVMVCCSEEYPNSYQPHTKMNYLVDSIIAIDHLVLAARNEGIGTCWVGAFHADKVERLIKASQDMRAVMLVVMGYPAREDAFKPDPYRKDIKDIYTEESF